MDGRKEQENRKENAKGDETDSDDELLIPTNTTKQPQRFSDVEPTQAYEMDTREETDSDDENLLAPPKAPKRLSDFEATQAYGAEGAEDKDKAVDIEATQAYDMDVASDCDSEPKPLARINTDMIATQAFTDSSDKVRTCSYSHY